MTQDKAEESQRRNGEQNPLLAAFAKLHELVSLGILKKMRLPSRYAAAMLGSG